MASTSLFLNPPALPACVAGAQAEHHSGKSLQMVQAYKGGECKPGAKSRKELTFSLSQDVGFCFFHRRVSPSVMQEEENLYSTLVAP